MAALVPRRSSDGAMQCNAMQCPGRHGESRTYDDLVGRASTHQVGAVTVEVAGLDDIIDAKEFAGRDKDAAALPELRALRAEQQPPG